MRPMLGPRRRGIWGEVAEENLTGEPDEMRRALRRIQFLCAALTLTVMVPGCDKVTTFLKYGRDEKLNIVSAEFVDLETTSYFENPTAPFEGGPFVGMRIELRSNLDAYSERVGRETWIIINLRDRSGPLIGFFANGSLIGFYRIGLIKETDDNTFVYEAAVWLSRDDFTPGSGYDLRHENSEICLYVKTVARQPDLFWGDTYRLSIPSQIEEMAADIEVISSMRASEMQE